MKGVSSIIAVVLILLILFALSSTAYIFFSGILSSRTSKIITVMGSNKNMVSISNDGTSSIASDEIRILTDNNEEVMVLNPQQIDPHKIVLLNFLPPQIDMGSSVFMVVGPRNSAKFTTQIIPNQFQRDSNTVALWHFDQGSGNVLRDSSLNLNNGVINGPIWVYGKFQSALEFDGNSDYVDVGDVVELEDQLTISAWVKLNGLSSTDYFIGEGAAFRIGVTNHNDVICWLRGDDSGGTDTSDTTSTSTSPISIGQWHHIACTWNGSTCTRRIYVNGNLEEDGTTNVVTFNGDSNNLAIGNAYVGASSFFNGVIDEIKISNVSLSQREILNDIYN
jgi:hypothetical protein